MMTREDADIVVLVGTQRTFPCIEARYNIELGWERKNLPMPQKWIKHWDDKQTALNSWEIECIIAVTDLITRSFNLYEQQDSGNPVVGFPFQVDLMIAKMVVDGLNKKKIVKMPKMWEMKVLDRFPPEVA